MNEKLNKKEGPTSSLYSFFISRFVEKNCLRIIQWGTYLILFTPLIISGKFFFPFVSPKSLYFMGLVEIIFAAYLFLAISLPKYRPKFNILLIAIILFVVVSILSSFSGANFDLSFWSKHERMTGILMWFHLLAFFVTTSSVFKKKDWVKVFEVSVMVAVLVSALAFLTAKEIGPLVKIGFETRGGATLGNSSFLASYLLFNVLLALYLFLIETKKEVKIILGSSFVLIAIALLLSTGRAAILAFLAGMILLFLLRLILCEKGKLRLAGISLLAVFLGGGMLIIFSSLEVEENAVQKMLAEKFSVGIGKDRLLVWDIGLKGWRERPWLGWGPENFGIVFTKNFDSRIFRSEIYGRDVWYDRAHNIVVDILVTRGILGFLAYLGIFASVFYILWRKYLFQKVSFFTAGIISVILISYFLQNLTVFDMVSSFMMFFLVLGFVGSIASQKDHRQEDVDEKKFSFRPWVGLIILVFFTISFFNFVIQPTRSNIYLIESFRGTNIAEKVSLYKKTLEISPLGKYQIRETLANREAMKYSNRNVAENISPELQKQELDFISKELEKSIEESPLLFSSYLALGKTYNIYGRLDSSKFSRAEEVLNKAIEVSPGNQQGYWVLAQTKLFKGELGEALSVAEKAVELEPAVKRSHLVVIEIAAIIRNMTGNQDLLKERVEASLKVNPAWASDIQSIVDR